MAKGQKAEAKKWEIQGLPIISDLSIPRDVDDADAFGLERRLGAICDAIFLKSTETPFAAMLSGGWGTGKTSAMIWLDGTLSRGVQAVDGSETMEIDTCWFYPWKYQSQEDVWRGLVAEVILRAIKIDRVDAAKIVKAASQFGAFLGRGFVRILSSLTVRASEAAEFDLKEAIGGVIEEYGKHVTPQEAYFNEFEAVLKKWVEETYPATGNRRLVVFIDDLDRCLPNIALQVLEALKLYLNIPNLVFIVGVDRNVIDKIVQKHYTDMVGEEAMKAGFAERAARYLDKMFPVEVDIEPTDEDVKAFFEKKIEPSEAWQRVPEEHRDLLRRVILDLGGQTPRTIIRLVNRIVIASGKRTDGLKIEQHLQRELLDEICRQCGFPSSPQRVALGREFFTCWSLLLHENSGPGLAIYLPSHVEAVLRHDMQQDKSVLSYSKDVQEQRFIAISEYGGFHHLSPLLNPKFDVYKELRSRLQVGLLLKIKYGAESDSKPADLDDGLTPEQWHQLTAVVATSMGVDPTALKREEVLAQTELWITDIGITDISFIKVLTKLQNLDLSSLPITDLTPISGITTLENLIIANTQVSDVSPLSSLIDLKKLNIRGTHVSDVSGLTSLTKLEELELSHTRITSVSGLEALENLRVLHLTGTSIADISPLSQLKNLERVSLKETSVSDWSQLEGMPKLKRVTIPDGRLWVPS